MARSKTACEVSASRPPLEGELSKGGKDSRRKRVSTLPLEQLAKLAIRQTGASTGGEGGFQFFRLPSEIRNMIFRLAYGSHLSFTLYGDENTAFVQTFGKMNATMVSGKAEYATDDGKTRICFYKGYLCNGWQQCSGGEIDGALLRTCKQSYIESISLLYENKSLGFRDISHTSSLFASLGSNGQRCVQHLEHIHETPLYGMRVCRQKAQGLSPLIERCSRLKTLTLYVCGNDIDLTKPMEQRHSVCQFRGIKLKIYRCCGPDEVTLEEYKQYCQEIIDLVAQPRKA